MAECLHCGKEFTPRRAGHVYHSPWCRHHGERKPYDPPPVDQDQISRLFNPRRNPTERIADDDWHVGGTEWQSLDAADTVTDRRRWFESLKLIRR
jgi:hypothetical protein